MVALAILAALAGLAGCDQDKVLYSGRNYLMFSDTLYHYAVQESNEKFEVPVSATRRADYDRTFAVEVVDKESTTAIREMTMDAIMPEISLVTVLM